MGIPRHPGKVKLVIGLLFGDPEIYPAIKKDLAKAFGKTDFESAPLDFNHTSYYNEEMGAGLKRRFLSFERLIGLNDICAVKVRTNRMESHFARGVNRRVNIDPGYLDLAKLVLFSTKDFSHRVYLDKGIFAEVTLSYKADGFNALPWTYPDYRAPEYLDIFKCIRRIYKEQISNARVK